MLPLALIPGRVEDHVVGDDDVVVGDVGGLHSGWGGARRNSQACRETVEEEVRGYDIDGCMGV